ncbi:MAG: metal-dependent transcriptional regulator [Actinobacteria bacterium]|nr:metal-dependent transcriptional regulator [Actinomycetota bacterium]
MNDLIDSTEMYLRTIWELEEEGIRPIRARLVERLHLSAPAVSETVARLEAEELLRLRDDRTVELTALGRQRAVSVMRKHRLAERLLVDVIGLDWPLVHVEACRWEHVISDAAERRLVAVLDAPTHDAHGNPIPGAEATTVTAGSALISLTDAAIPGGVDVSIARMSEHLQADVDTMRRFHEHGLLPGARARAVQTEGGTRVTVNGEAIELDDAIADLVYVTVAPGHEPSRAPNVTADREGAAS